MLQLFALGPNEHVTHEEGMVGACADNSDIDPILLIPAGIAVDNIDSIAGVEVVDGSFAIDLPNLKKSGWSVSRMVLVCSKKQGYLADEFRALSASGKGHRLGEDCSCASLLHQVGLSFERRACSFPMAFHLTAA